MIKKILLVFQILIMACTVHNSDMKRTVKNNVIQGYIEQLSDESTLVQNEAAEQLYKMGKGAIPHLIDSMGTTDLISVDHWNPLSSQLPPGYPAKFKITSLATEIYAYMIEVIISRDKFICHNKEKLFLCQYDNHAYFSFQMLNKKSGYVLVGLMYNKEMGYILLGRDIEEMKKVDIDIKKIKDIYREDAYEVKRIYTEWWEKNKHKSIEQMRNDWKSGIRPLSGTDYEWSGNYGY